MSDNATIKCWATGLQPFVGSHCLFHPCFNYVHLCLPELVCWSFKILTAFQWCVFEPFFVGFVPVGLRTFYHVDYYLKELLSGGRLTEWWNSKEWLREWKRKNLDSRVHFLSETSPTKELHILPSSLDFSVTETFHNLWKDHLGFGEDKAWKSKDNVEGLIITGQTC